MLNEKSLSLEDACDLASHLRVLPTISEASVRATIGSRFHDENRVHAVEAIEDTIRVEVAHAGDATSLIGEAVVLALRVPSPTGLGSVLVVGALTARTSLLVLLLASSHGLEDRSEEHTSELQSRGHIVCRLLRE